MIEQMKSKFTALGLLLNHDGLQFAKLKLYSVFKNSGGTVSKGSILETIGNTMGERLLTCVKTDFGRGVTGVRGDVWHSSNAIGR